MNFYYWIFIVLLIIEGFNNGCNINQSSSTNDIVQQVGNNNQNIKMQDAAIENNNLQIYNTFILNEKNSFERIVLSLETMSLERQEKFLARDPKCDICMGFINKIFSLYKNYLNMFNSVNFGITMSGLLFPEGYNFGANEFLELMGYNHALTKKYLQLLLKVKNIKGKYFKPQNNPAGILLAKLNLIYGLYKGIDGYISQTAVFIKDHAINFKKKLYEILNSLSDEKTYTANGGIIFSNVNFDLQSENEEEFEKEIRKIIATVPFSDGLIYDKLKQEKTDDKNNEYACIYENIELKLLKLKGQITELANINKAQFKNLYKFLKLNNNDFQNVDS